MAAKKASTGFEFIIASLNKDKKASYKDIAAAAATKKMKVFPVMFGRAQAMLGIVSQSKRGKSKGARSKVANARSKVAPVPAKVAIARAKAAPVSAKRAKAAPVSVKRAKAAPVSVKRAKAAKAAPVRPAVVVGKRGPGRPRKNAAPVLGVTLESIIAVVKSGALEKARYQKALERIQRLVADALA